MPLVHYVSQQFMISQDFLEIKHVCKLCMFKQWIPGPHSSWGWGLGTRLHKVFIGRAVSLEKLLRTFIMPCTCTHTHTHTHTHTQVVLGGGQEAMEVTTTVTKAGKFDTRFYHLVFEEEIGRVKGHFGPINSLKFHPDGER